jgi:segregation and condensation protein A
LQPAYQVQLPVFEGPLDLLLHLIQQQELDITTIALAQVTDQYLAHLHALQEVVPDDLTAFLTVAARLLLIKSRALLPRPPVEKEEEEEDVGEDLVRQLREYRRFKQIAQLLQTRTESALHAYPRTLPPSKQVGGWEPRLDLSGTELGDLTAALYALLSEGGEADTGFTVTPHTITIEHKIVQISTSLQAQQSLTFDSLLDDARSKVEIIVTLLALLEMIRDRRVWVRQESVFGTILIEPRDQSQNSAAQDMGSDERTLPGAAGSP